MTTKWSPKEDGKTHINVYSQGKTEVGRWASNFQEAAFIHPTYGAFMSMEGLWYWLSVLPDEPRRGLLRLASGFQAKKLGRELRGKDWVYSPGFEADIKLGLRTKYETYPAQLKAFQMWNHLPLAHYYVMRGKVIYVPDADWILEELDSIRKGKS